MLNLDPRKREILRLIGVELWRERKGIVIPNSEAGIEVSIDAATAQRKREQVSEFGISSKTNQGQVEILSSSELVTARTSRGDSGQNSQKFDDVTETDGSSLDNIRTMVSQCQSCILSKTRTQTVFGSGNTKADWLFVGEAPGQDDELQGLPFVGRSGQLLTRMIASLDQARDSVYIANVLKCRPLNDRDPLADDIEQCEPYLQQQIREIAPKVIISLGRISSQVLLKSTQPLEQMRGQIYRYGPLNTPLVVTSHPSDLLRNPIDKRKTWEDLLLAKSVVKNEN